MQVGAALTPLTIPGGNGHQPPAPHLAGSSDGQGQPLRGAGTGGTRAPLLKAIEETLNQLGLKSAQSAGGAGASTIASAGNKASTTSDALHAFVHVLYQSLHSGGATQAPHAHQASAHAAYGAAYSSTLSSHLENLVQSLQNSGGAATSPLNAAYQNLLNVLNNGGGAGPAPATLETFVQDLLQNVQNGTATSVFNGASMISTTV